MSFQSARWVVVAFVVLAGCKKANKAEVAVGGVGVAVAKGNARDLRLSPNGQVASYLLEAEKPRLDGIPPQMLVGELYVVPLSGGNGRKVANGVTNVPGGHLFSPDSKWILFLSGYNPATQSGELQALDLSQAAAEPVKLGQRVTYMLVSPDSKFVAFVDDGVLKLGALAQGPFRDVSGEVSNVHFSPDGQFVAFKRKLSAAGGLFVTTTEKAEAPRKLGEQVGDYLVSPDSQHVAFAVRSESVRGNYDLFKASAPGWKLVKVAEGTQTFAFSPDGKWLGRTEGGKPEQLGDLHVGAATGGAGRKVGEKVLNFEFAPDSAAVAYLELYDVPARAGVLGVASLPNGKSQRVGNRVPNFIWGADGKTVAFLSRFLKPIYSVDLMLFRLGGEAATKVHPGVFGYGFTQRTEHIVFRTACIRDGRACDLYQLDLSKPAEQPKKILEGVYSFKPSEKGDRLLVTYARYQGDLFDVALYNLKTAQRLTLEQSIQLPALYAKDDGSQVAYIVADRARPGVYLAQGAIP